jgi:hypothetical protein
MAREVTNIRFLAKVRLTPVDAVNPEGVDVVVSQLLTYSQEKGFTRLRLTGRKTLDVKETTARIDSLIRDAGRAS